MLHTFIMDYVCTLDPGKEGIYVYFIGDSNLSL